MKIFRTTDIKQIDNYTIEYEPIASIDLMKRAAYALNERLAELIPADGIIKIFAGTGNNGGDAFFVAQKLADDKQDVTVYFCPQQHASLSADCAKAYRIFSTKYAGKIVEISSLDDFPTLTSTDYVIDGLFGSGLNRPLEGFYAGIVERINATHCTVFAIDIPSGLMGEDNSTNNPDHIIHAARTFSFQFPKLAFLFPENEILVGEWETIDIGLHAEAIANIPTNFYMTDTDFVNQHLKKRTRFSHKGTYGHALIIGGSYGKIGAAVLAACACMRSGTGLLTVHVPRCGYDIMQISIPEAMISTDKAEQVFSQAPEISPYNAVGIGIGIGKATETAEGLKNLLKSTDSPIVFDADALNIIAENNELLQLVPPNSIFTPHPKELERLIGASANSFERIEKTIQFAAAYNIYVLIKGAYTIIVCPDGNCWFNPTGNPGMATAGSGDVLCGIITGLLAQQYTPFEAAVLGTYFHGQAGDTAAGKHSQPGMIASDIIEELRIEPTTDPFDASLMIV